MVGRLRRTDRKRHRLVVLFAFFGFLVAASMPAAAENASIEFSPDRIVRGGRTTVQIRTDIPWGEEVRIDRPELVGPMVWWAYPYARPWLDNSPGGSGKRMVEVLGTLRIDAPGIFLVGPFRVSAGELSAVTEPQQIIGLEQDEAGFPFPVTTMWRTVPEQAWQGQALSIVLEARNLTSLALPDSVTLTGAPNGLLENAAGLGSIVTRPHANEILYDVPMGSWIWTPGEAGAQRFPAARVRIAGLNRAAPAFTTVVRALPEAVQESGAVGYFRLTLDVDEGPYTGGEIISVRVRVEGEGNLNVLRLPVPIMEGSEPVGQFTSSAYIPGPEGFSGWREERYDFQLKMAGTQNLRLPAWSWLEPVGAGRIRTQTALGESIDVEMAAATGIGSEQRSSFLGGDMFRYRKLRFQWRENYWFLLALPGFIALIVLFLLRRPIPPAAALMLVLPLLISASNHTQNDETAADSAATAVENRDFDTAAEIYRELRTTYGDMPGLLHDMALLEVEQGNTDTGILMLRQAVLFRPGSRVIASSLAKVENRLGLDNQVPSPLRWSPAIVFAIWLLSVNAFFLVLYRFLRKRRAGEAIVFISVVFVFVFSTVFMVITENRWKSSTAVVTADSEPLRKIPGPLAADWIKLPEGTAVSVTAKENDDCLVQTGYGLEGWLPESSLLFVTGVDNGF